MTKQFPVDFSKTTIYHISMKTLELNTDKIKSEMDRLGVRKGWLAKKLKMTPAMTNYIFNKKPVGFAVRLADIFQLDPKDLIK